MFQEPLNVGAFFNGGNVMSNNIIDRLFSSFTELEDAIQSAQKSLEERGGIPESIKERLKSYDTILAKQRKLAQDLCCHISSGDWDEVSRHVNIINGLSAMIRDDARAILSSLALNSDAPAIEQEVNYC